MKQSKTPLWKKSCLCGALGWEDITEWLEEISENGDMYGYEDSSVEGYYNEYKDEFNELSVGAWALYEQLISDEVGGLREVWNDMTVGLLGDLYTVWGFDSVELDYFRLRDGFEEELAEKEAVKRLERMTKSELIHNFRKVLTAIVMFYDIKAAHDCLTSIVEELDEKGALLEQKNERINLLYKDLTGRSSEAFDVEIENLPPRMWVE